MLPGGPELLLVLLVFTLLFGASKIPKLARATGEAKGELEKGLRESRAATDEQEVTND